MNFSINSFGKLLSLLVVSIFVIFIYLLNDLFKQSEDLKQVEKNKYLMILKSDELRQSSDDLTKFARTYVITSNVEYRNNYYKILDIRNAKIARPLHYNRIYWDLLEPLRSQRHPLKNKSSLHYEMKKLPYTESQYNLLQLAQNNSDDLVFLELKAFNAMDNNKQDLAIKLLYSNEYHKAKEKIMLPIDKFLFSLARLTQNQIDSYNTKIDNLFSQILFLVIFSLFIFSSSLFVLRKKVMLPILSLTRDILSFKTGSNEIGNKSFYDDEIGMMSKQFYSMKKKLDEKYETVKQLSLTDSLTGIRNRRSFFEVGEGYVKLALRRKKELSLIMLDIDYFKKINDTYGHVIGDEILKKLTKFIQINLRESDIFARYGGEEFVVLLADTDANGALFVAQKIRSNIQDTPFINEEYLINITVSMGVKQLKDEILLRELIRNADEALYKAKENGRNRVECN